jgi:hypothetical protein
MRIGTALLFVLMMNTFFFLGQTSIEKINPDGPVSFFNYEGSWMAGKDAGNFTLNTDLSDAIPDSQSTVGVETGNVFTDTWRTISTWLKTSIPGYGFMERLVNGPNYFLKAAGLPVEISFVLAWMWHMLAIFLFIAFIRGGAQI